MPQVDWSTATTFHVSKLQVATFTSYTTGDMGTTNVIPSMTASTAPLTTATTVGVTAIGFQTTAAFTSHTQHVNKLTDDVAVLFKLVNAIVNDLKSST